MMHTRVRGSKWILHRWEGTNSRGERGWWDHHCSLSLRVVREHLLALGLYRRRQVRRKLLDGERCLRKMWRTRKVGLLLLSLLRTANNTRR